MKKMLRFGFTTILIIQSIVMFGQDTRIFMPRGTVTNYDNLVFMNDTIGYFTHGSYRDIYKTTDGGLTWSSATPNLPVFQGNARYYGLYVFGYDSLLILTKSRLIRTIDGGVSIYDIPIDSSDSDNALIFDCYAFDRFAFRAKCQQGFYYTINGGNEWITHGNLELFAEDKSPECINYGLPGHIFSDGSFYFGDDYYITGNSEKVAGRSTIGFNDFHFVNDQIGIAGQGGLPDQLKPKKQMFRGTHFEQEGYGGLYYTDNGGQTWIRIREEGNINAPGERDHNYSSAGYYFSWDCKTVLHVIYNYEPYGNSTGPKEKKHSFSVSRYPFTSFEELLPDAFGIGERSDITDYTIESVKTNPLVSHKCLDDTDRDYIKHCTYTLRSNLRPEIKSYYPDDSVSISLQGFYHDNPIIDVYCLPEYSNQPVLLKSDYQVSYSNRSINVHRKALGSYGYIILKTGKEQFAKEYSINSISAVNVELYSNVIPNTDNPLNLLIPGRPLRFKVVLDNNYKTILTSKAIISTNDPFITITDSIANINNLKNGQTVTTGDEFEIIFSEDIPDSYIAHFKITLDDKFDSDFTASSTFYLPVVLKAYDIFDFLVDDDGNPDSQGDGDGYIEPGETVELLPMVFPPTEFSINNYYPPVLTLLTLHDSINIWSAYNDQEFGGGIYIDSLSRSASFTSEDFVIDYNYSEPYQFEVGILFQNKFLRFGKKNHSNYNQRYLYSEYRGDLRHADEGFGYIENSLSVDLRFYESFILNKAFEPKETSTILIDTITVDTISVDTISVDTTGISNINKLGFDKISVFPNPNSGTFYLDNLPVEEELVVSLYDLKGIPLMNRKVKGIRQKIVLPDIEPGIYILGIRSPHHHKFIRMIYQ